MPVSHKNRTILFVAAAIASIVACGGGEKTADTTKAVTPSPQPSAAALAAGPQTPDPGHQVIVIQAMTDEQGNNRFSPDKIEAHRGDVLRFTLKAGVHNVHFLPDSNPGKQGLPAASDLLQLPGQTYDVKVTFEPGKYYFQCDPHAALGMKGHLEVEGD
jgi:plastocyanin